MSAASNLNRVIKSIANGDLSAANGANLDTALAAAVLALTTANNLTATATLDFPSTTTGLSADLTIALVGAAVGDTVLLGTPAAPAANTSFTAFVSATDVVTVRFNNYSAGTVNPASASFKVTIIK